MASKCESDRLRLARIVLQELRDEPLGWSELEKRVIRQCGTSGKFSVLMGWMIRRGYIVKAGASGSRAPYKINSEKVAFTLDGEVNIKL